MTVYFLDSSALVKRYVVETGTTWVRSITDHSARNAIIIAHVTLVEIVSGTMRRRRENTITPRTARAVRLLLDRHASYAYWVIGLSSPIVRRAEDLLETYPLRAYDAVQLASALESNARLTGAQQPSLAFVSADNRLSAAAVAEGLPTDDPNKHP